MAVRREARLLLAALAVLGALGCPRAPTTSTAPPPAPDAEPVVYVEAAPAPSKPAPEAAPAPRRDSDSDASESDRALAKQLFVQGLERYQQGDLAGALGFFEQAYALVPLAALNYNIARCLEGLGRAVEACAAYREVRARSDDTSMRGAAADALTRLGC